MMNTKLEAAARQVLEALEDLQKYGVKQSKALFALREALAEQAVEPSEAVKLSRAAQALYAKHPTFRGATPLTWDEAPIAVKREWLDKAQQQAAEPVAHCRITQLRGESWPTSEVHWVSQPVEGPLYTQAPTQQPLTDEQKAVLRECRTQAMTWAGQARIPECGAFGGIAQDLDWLCGQLGITGSKKGGAA